MVFAHAYVENGLMDSVARLPIITAFADEFMPTEEFGNFNASASAECI